MGRTGRPNYRIVAIDESKKRSGRPIEVLGKFNPLTEPPTITMSKDRVKYWLGVGAKPTPTVAALIR